MLDNLVFHLIKTIFKYFCTLKEIYFMKVRYFFIALALFLAEKIQAQSFAPAPGNIGTTAIHKDSSIILAWASGIDLQRGYLNISDKNLGLASFGLPESALFQAEGNSFDVVSLGDSGVAILTFDLPIINGNGFDFAVFENGFADNYVEYAFVEVSSDGVHFVRFPSSSETPTNVQMSSFEYSDCRYVNNLAGKYRQGFGTPFDLEELTDSANLDLNHITHVKIIDVIGSIDPQFGTLDAQGNIINDPWPSAFESGGFDLDGVGIMNQNVSGLEVENFEAVISETDDEIIISDENEFQIKVVTLDGKICYQSDNKSSTFHLKKRPTREFSFLNILVEEKSYVFKVFY